MPYLLLIISLLPKKDLFDDENSLLTAIIKILFKHRKPPDKYSAKIE